jgi:uncharacterized protein YkwD
MRGALLSIIVLCLAPTAPASAQQVLTPPPERDESGPEDGEAAAVIREVNRVRAAHGLTPVSADPSLMEAAAEYAEELRGRGDLSHVGVDGSTPPQRAELAGYEGGDVAETLAAGFPSAPETVEAWMESPAHREALLKPDAAYAGAAREDAPESEYQAYWTMLLAAPAK